MATVMWRAEEYNGFSLVWAPKYNGETYEVLETDENKSLIIVSRVVTRGYLPLRRDTCIELKVERFRRCSLDQLTHKGQVCDAVISAR